MCLLLVRFAGQEPARMGCPIRKDAKIELAKTLFLSMSSGSSIPGTDSFRSAL